MEHSIKLFAGMLLLLTGCVPFTDFQTEKKGPVQVVVQDHEPSSKLTSKFWLNGDVFSISNDGVIYFVDPIDNSIVNKASVTNYKIIDRFIDLKEWLKPDSSGKLRIDDIWVDHEGRLILAESFTGKILRISQDARKLENLADSYDGYRFSEIQGLIGSGTGEIFVGSPNSATIYKLDSQAGKLQVLNEDLVRPNDFIFNEAGNRLLVAESNPNRVIVYNLNDSTESMIKSWDLIKFAKFRERPVSMDTIDPQGDSLVVISGRGKKLQIFDLTLGKLINQTDLPFPCFRIRAHKGWIYLQARKGIIRRKIPDSVTFK